MIESSSRQRIRFARVVVAVDGPFAKEPALVGAPCPASLPGVTKGGDAYVNVPLLPAPGVNGLAPRLSIDYGGGPRQLVDAYDAMGERVLAVKAAGTPTETRTAYAYDCSGAPPKVAYPSGQELRRAARSPPPLAMIRHIHRRLANAGHVDTRAWPPSGSCTPSGGDRSSP